MAAKKKGGNEESDAEAIPAVKRRIVQTRKKFLEHKFRREGKRRFPRGKQLGDDEETHLGVSVPNSPPKQQLHPTTIQLREFPRGFADLVKKRGNPRPDGTHQMDGKFVKRFKEGNKRVPVVEIPAGKRGVSQKPSESGDALFSKALEITGHAFVETEVSEGEIEVVGIIAMGNGEKVAENAPGFGSFLFGDLVENGGAAFPTEGR